jgi:hypothetical protein
LFGIVVTGLFEVLPAGELKSLIEYPAAQPH